MGGDMHFAKPIDGHDPNESKDLETHLGEIPNNELIPRGDKPTLVIVDMQDFYFEHLNPDELQAEILNYIHVIEQAQQSNIPIYVLEYNQRGKTTEKLREVLSNSPYETIIKPSGDGFQRTDLNDRLQKRDIDSIILMGINASTCVKLTAEGAIDKGYLIITSPDVIAEPSEWTYGKSLDWFESKGKVFKDHKEIIEYLKEWSNHSSNMPINKAIRPRNTSAQRM